MAKSRNALLNQMVRLIKIYQNKIVPGLREEIRALKESRVDVVRCRDCKMRRLLLLPRIRYWL